MFDIAFPTRNRPNELFHTLGSLFQTLPVDAPTRVHVIHDCPPDDQEGHDSIDVAADMIRQQDYHLILHDKSSLSQLWNRCILCTDSDWVLIASDDIEYQPGWYEFLTEQIQSGKYLQILMLTYSAFCLHKSMIPLIGWFDERFTTGYYEDNDWQLRISESGLKDRVSFDKNECLIRNRPSGRHRWDSAENFWWIRDKWNNADHWGQPSFRQVGEQYLYPMTMKEYEERFNIESRIPLINETMVKNGIGVFH